MKVIHWYSLKKFMVNGLIEPEIIILELLTISLNYDKITKNQQTIEFLVPEKTTIFFKKIRKIRENV